MGQITVKAVAGESGPELEIAVKGCPPAPDAVYRGHVWKLAVDGPFISPPTVRAAGGPARPAAQA